MANFPSNERLSPERLNEIRDWHTGEARWGSQPPKQTELAIMAQELFERRVEVEKYRAWAASCDQSPPETKAPARDAGECCPIHPDVKIVTRPSTSVNGGSIRWGCAVCNCLEIERLRGFVSDEERHASIDRACSRSALKASVPTTSASTGGTPPAPTSPVECPKCGASDSAECPCSPEEQWEAGNV